MNETVDEWIKEIDTLKPLEEKRKKINEKIREKNKRKNELEKKIIDHMITGRYTSINYKNMKTIQLKEQKKTNTTITKDDLKKNTEEFFVLLDKEEDKDKLKLTPQTISNGLINYMNKNQTKKSKYFLTIEEEEKSRKTMEIK